MIDPDDVPIVKGTPDNISLIFEIIKLCYHLGGLKLLRMSFLKDDWTAEKCSD